LTAKTEETPARGGTQQRHHGEQHDPAQALDGDRLHQEGRRRRSRQVRSPKEGRMERLPGTDFEHEEATAGKAEG
jgi:hypothetical protein